MRTFRSFVRAPAASHASRLPLGRLTRRVLPAVALLLLASACVAGDIITGPGSAQRQLEGSWRRTEQVNDAWWGNALVETTWRFRRDRADYTEVITDLAGRPYETFGAAAVWYLDDYDRDRIVLDYYDPPGLGRVSVRFDLRTSGRDDILYLDGLRYVRVAY